MKLIRIEEVRNREDAKYDQRCQHLLVLFARNVRKHSPCVVEGEARIGPFPKERMNWRYQRNSTKSFPRTEDKREIGGITKSREAFNDHTRSCKISNAGCERDECARPGCNVINSQMAHLSSLPTFTASSNFVCACPPSSNAFSCVFSSVSRLILGLVGAMLYWVLHIICLRH